MPRIINDILHAPHFIFIRNPSDELTDRSLLERFTIGDYELVSSLPKFRNHVVVRREPNWLHLADDWSYSLWHAPSTRDSLLELSCDHDIYQYSVGECDHSFDFRYFSGGAITREYVVEDPTYHNGIVVKDDGTELPGERDSLELPDEQQRVLGIARALGIDVSYTMDQLVFYANPNSASLIEIGEPSNAPKRAWWRFW
ncbi:hypothetical protein LOC67_22640 [Stieleria sp. JC731]|uniref:hypothetical protein n=1 Tax=Stieleria sp. JC731 TaxID=2894195 RepID=UPI001E36E1FE|nr:hypothetical protein [Stieleria sp. JC731]MCC9603357.1 hypothetical protein [Stieleria sp. JC731]